MDNQMPAASGGEIIDLPARTIIRRWESWMTLVIA